MFGDPQTITIAGVAHTLPRIKSEGLKAVYQKSDETVTLTISHQLIKSKLGDRIRSMARLDLRKVVLNPLSGTSDYDTITHYTVTERPSYGFSSTEVGDLIAAHELWLDATAIGKLYGRES
jgi:hypothetical protein